jgi:16S rRNA (guanine527-N7)-methyltransferase
MRGNLEDILRSGAGELGLELPESAFGRFTVYADFLSERNGIMNLTAVSGETDIATLHFLDSLAPLTLPCFKAAAARVVDVGSGAGFPGLPMKIARPELALTLLDARWKRTEFLAELCRLLRLEDVRCVTARAEESAGERYGYAVARAVARLDVLCELCLPLVEVGGAFIAMKGIRSDEEVAEAENAARVLGAGNPEVFDYTLPGTDIRRRCVVMRKISATPRGYPRRFARIKAAPL